MLNVLCFGRLYGASLGGVERHVQSLIEGLAGRVRFVDLVPSRDGRFHEHRIAGNPAYELPILGTIASAPLCPSMPLWARRLHREQRFDLVHLHFPDPTSHLAALALPTSLPVVISWHSDIVRQKRLRMLYRPFESRILRRAAAIVVATPRHYTSSTVLRSASIEHKLSVVPYGMDFARFDAPPAGAEEIRRRHGTRLVFALGRHVYYKGFEYLIEAMARVPNARLLLGSDGPLTPALRAQAAALGLGDRVVFLGRVPEDELSAYYHAADVFCLPSVEPAEAFGLAQAEAMACGRPVVCCELNNGVTYVNRHGETGLVVSPRDAASLAAALRELLDNPQRREQMGKAAAQRLRAEFTIAAQCDGMMKVYERVSRITK